MLKLPVLNLGDLEVATIECLWAIGEGDPKRVHAEIGTARGVTHNTVQSALERLYRKGLLSRRKFHHAYLYQAAVDRATLVGKAIDGVVSKLSQGETGAVLAAFVDFAARTDLGTLNELERLIEARMKQTG